MSTTLSGGQDGARVKIGRGGRGALGIASLAITAGIALVAACGGNEFCQESRTCPASPTGGVGGDGAPVGGADSAAGGTSGAAGGTRSSAGASASAGQGGEAPVSCKTDADCDDGDACNGAELCIDRVCELGDAMDCPVGFACVAPAPICVPATTSPWIVYASDDDIAAVTDLYAVKPDFLGKMQPIKITPKLDAGWSMVDVGAWSPDGQAAIVTAKSAKGDDWASYLLRFVDGSPQEPLLLTKGLSASKLSKPVWSPSGKTLGITRDDGFFLIDIDAKDQVTQTPLSGATQDSVSAWFKNDGEIAFAARNIVTKKFTIAVATKSGANWTVDPIVVDLTAANFQATPDVSVISYVVPDMVNIGQATAWSVESVKGATPTKIVGPIVDLAVQASQDGKRFTMATTLKVGGDSTVFGGPMTMLTSPPLLKDHLAAKASYILPQALGAGWSNDAKYAAIFQPYGFGRQLVLYEPGAATEWNALTVQQIANPGSAGDPVWSPDSRVLALYGQVAADAAQELMLVSTQSYETRSLDFGQVVQVVGFSSGAEFLSYRISSGSPTFVGGLVDLRPGFEKATARPFASKVTHQLFAAHSLDLLYSDGASCNYIDLSGAVPAKGVRVNGSGTAGICTFQVLPK